MPSVALVLVSHSDALASGVRDLVGQMAPDVTVATAGGLPGGGVGTDLERVQAALREGLGRADRVVVLYDLGSAVMTAEIALEMLEEPARAVLVDGPFVEGALAAGVAAQGGARLDGVVAAVREAGAVSEQEPASAAASGAPAGAAGKDEDLVRERDVVLTNPLGLHARPAAAIAALAGSAAEQGTRVQIGRSDGPLVDATALLRIVGLSLRGGAAARLVATGPGADAVLDELDDLLSSGFGELDPTGGDPAPTAPARGRSAPVAAHRDSDSLTGVAACPGVAVGPVLVLDRPSPDLPVAAAADLEEERRDAWAARDRAVALLRTAGRAEPGAGVLALHAALLADPDLNAAVAARLDAGEPAATAWWSGALDLAATMAESGSELLAERAADVRDVALRVLEALGVPPAAPEPEWVAGRVVVAEDLPPSWVPHLAESGMIGLALAGAGPTSHAVVLARGLAVPTVVALGPSLLRLAGDVPAEGPVLLDGSAGLVELSPAEGILAEARARADVENVVVQQRRSAAQTAVTVHGRLVPVLANVASVTESARARREGADGIGLLRTEMLLSDRSDLPTEDEQLDALVAIAREQGGRRVVVRTFDIGGDKPVAALHLDPARNGFLGERGLRLGLNRPDLLRVQLRAVLRAAARLASVGTRLALMTPMVTVAEEVVALREELAAARAALEADGLEAGQLAGIGIMVEVPAAALAMDDLAPLVDFVSVGTNDLVQYVMAAERTNAAVAHLYRPDHPAVWRLLQLLVEGAHAGGCEVSVCGQMAAEPDLAARLVELGVDDLSVPPSDVGRVKAALRRT